jgi:WD40 repeat protein
VLIWDLATAMTRTLKETGGALSLAFNRAGSLLAAGAGDEAIVWNLRASDRATTLRAHERPVRFVLFPPRGDVLVTGSFDGTVRTWDVAGAASGPRATWRHGGDVSSLAMSPDGRFVASGSRDATVGVWDLQTGAPVVTITAHASEVRSVAFSPDGALLASADDGGTVVVSEVSTGEEMLRLARPGRAVSFQPGGAWLATAGGPDNRVTLWDVAIDRWPDHACGVANRNLTCAEWRQFMDETPYQAVCPQHPAPDCNVE